MDNAALQPLQASAVAADPAPAVTTDALRARLAALPMSRKLLLAGGIALLIAAVVASLFWGRQDQYKVLFANLSDKDGGAIIAQLSQMNVPYRHSDGGAAILVPADRVHDVRLKLAQAGLPKGGTTGFELMDNARFGTTQFQERLNFQRGLEGELVRSITALAAVQAARVHLALPQQNGFFREQQKPSASVLLTLHPGRVLDRTQIAGIVHLVSSSVPEMDPKAVSVLDQNGALLSSGDNVDLDAQQLQYINKIEAQYTKRILDILEPVVGRDNLRAQVSAEVDFSQTEMTAEEFRPERSAVRSMQASEQITSATNTPTGVPGAATNQPPSAASAVVNGAAPGLQTAQQGNIPGVGKRDTVTNYELDKTVRVTRVATGTVKRLSAAVVVNFRSVVDPKGKTQAMPLSQEEIDKLTALVQETVGFSKDRGDSVKLINTPFRAEKVVEEEIPLWKQAEFREVLQQISLPLGLALLAAIVVFGAVRPALVQRKIDETPLTRLDAVVDDAQALPGAEGGAAGALPGATEAELIENDPVRVETMKTRIEEARRLARENPIVVANIVRSWVDPENAPQK